MLSSREGILTEIRHSICEKTVKSVGSQILAYALRRSNKRLTTDDRLLGLNYERSDRQAGTAPPIIAKFFAASRKASRPKHEVDRTRGQHDDLEFNSC